MRSSAPQWRTRHGLERLPAGGEAPRHQHVDAHATIVLNGAYVQFAYAGRLIVEEGDVLIQPALDCHTSRKLSERLEVIRLPWRRDCKLGGVYRNCRLDEVVRAAHTDIVEAAHHLAEEIDARPPVAPAVNHWADALVAAFADQPRLSIAAWANVADLSREHISRGFAAIYGVSPVQFRAELRAREAYFRIIRDGDSLAEIATDLGFADQAHMTRAIKAFTGATPKQWRMSRLFKTQGGAAVTSLE